MKTIIIYTFGSTLYTKEVNNKQHAKNYINKIASNKNISLKYKIVENSIENIQNAIVNAKKSLAHSNLYTPIRVYR